MSVFRVWILDGEKMYLHLRHFHHLVRYLPMPIASNIYLWNVLHDHMTTYVLLRSHTVWVMQQKWRWVVQAKVTDIKESSGFQTTWILRNVHEIINLLTFCYILQEVRLEKNISQLRLGVQLHVMWVKTDAIFLIYATLGTVLKNLIHRFSTLFNLQKDLYEQKK